MNHINTPFLFDNRKEMLKHYCGKIVNPKILEIGVFKGDFLNFLFEECNVASIDGVDLFEGTTYSGDCDGNNIVYCDIGKKYIELCENYKQTDKINLYKSNSLKFLEKQEDNTYDIIYIDASHSYNGTKKELISSYKKIKNNGYIMGHDYEINTQKTKRIYEFGVKQAVDEFCFEYNQNILAKALDGCVSFCIQVSK